MGNRHPSIAPYETFATQDGTLALAVGNDRQFAALCAVLEAPELVNDPRFAQMPEKVLRFEDSLAPSRARRRSCDR
jgi:crotonobetainyl-CoA:carnitine CoA-transferase CaiB-like acyl-CoA transferase